MTALGYAYWNGEGVPQDRARRKSCWDAPRNSVTRRPSASCKVAPDHRLSGRIRVAAVASAPSEHEFDRAVAALQVGGTPGNSLPHADRRRHWSISFSR